MNRLKSSKAIKALFDEGLFCKSYPHTCRFLVHPSTHPEIKVAVAVPRRLFKRAVDRNLIKRRMRESYRQHFKTIQNRDLEGRLECILIYNSKDLLAFSEIDKSMAKLSLKLLMRL